MEESVVSDYHSAGGDTSSHTVSSSVVSSHGKTANSAENSLAANTTTSGTASATGADHYLIKHQLMKFFKTEDQPYFRILLRSPLLLGEVMKFTVRNMEVRKYEFRFFMVSVYFFTSLFRVFLIHDRDEDRHVSRSEYNEGILYYSLLFPTIPYYILLFPTIPYYSLLFPTIPYYSLTIPCYRRRRRYWKWPKSGFVIILGCRRHVRSWW